MLKIKIFGGTEVTVDRLPSRRITDFGGVKPRQILEILAAAAGQPVAKERLVDMLWHGEPPRSYEATLHSYVSVLRRRLGENARSAILTESHGYRLDLTTVDIDLVRFRRLVQVASQATGHRRAAVVEEAVSLVSGELLASEPYEDWAGDERMRFTRELLAATTTGAVDALQDGSVDAAVRLARTATDVDPYAEDAWQCLIQALQRSGRRHEALQAFSRLRAMMLEDLGVEPSQRTREIYLSLLRETRVNSTSESSAGEVSTLLGLLRTAVESLPRTHINTAEQRLAAQVISLMQTA